MNYTEIQSNYPLISDVISSHHNVGDMNFSEIPNEVFRVWESTIQDFYMFSFEDIGKQLGCILTESDYNDWDTIKETNLIKGMKFGTKPVEMFFDEIGIETFPKFITDVAEGKYLSETESSIS